MKYYLSLFFLVFFIPFVHSQVCLSLDSWSLTMENGDGTCDYSITVTVDSGNGASGPAEFSIDGVVVYTEPNCVCNPETITFPITVACGSTIDINVNYDAPGNGNDCTGTTGPIILPVVWLEPLNSKLVGNSVLLEFATAQQINNSHFEVLHSTDGKKYQEIGKIEGEGNYTLNKYYQFTHDNPEFGSNFYKIRQVDLDGNFGYSNISQSKRESLGVKIYPNPASDYINLVTPESGNVYLSNQFGYIVKSFKVNEGSNHINLIDIPNGIYVLRINSKVSRFVKK